MRAVTSTFPWRTPPRPSESLPEIAAPERPPAAVGVEFLIEAAGGEAAVVRAAGRHLRRPFRDANPLEATEALGLTLVERAPGAVAQLGGGAGEAINQAAGTLYRNTLSRRLG